MLPTVRFALKFEFKLGFKLSETGPELCSLTDLLTLPKTWAVSEFNNLVSKFTESESTGSKVGNLIQFMSL